MRALVVPLLLLLLTAEVSAQIGDPRVRVTVDPQQGEVGLVMQVSLLVLGDAAADCELVALPELAGARLSRVAGPSTSKHTSLVNGKLSRSMQTEWRFQLVPSAAGQLLLAPFELLLQGERVRSSPVNVPIAPSDDIEADALRFRIETDVTELWVGQVFELELIASLSAEAAANRITDGLEIDLPWFDDLREALSIGASAVPSSTYDVLFNGGRQRLPMTQREVREGAASRIELRRVIVFVASEAGMIDLRGSRFSAQIATEVATRRDPLSFFGGNTKFATRSKVVDAFAAGAVLTVRDPPRHGRPPGFTNAVGQFELRSVASPRVLSVGDTCNLVLELRGQGNLEFVEWPEFEQLADHFRIYDKTEAKSESSRRLALQISPRNDRVTEIPVLSLPYFDPETESYAIAATTTVPLEVSAGGDGGLTDLEVAQDVMRDLETIRETLPPPAPAPWPEVYLWAPAGALLLLAELRRRRVSWREANPARLRRRGARRDLDAALSSATDAAQLGSAFARFLAARLDGPPAGLSARDAAARLDDDALAADLVRTVEVWEAAYLGGASLPVDRVAGEARALADRVESAT